MLSRGRPDFQSVFTPVVLYQSLVERSGLQGESDGFSCTEAILIHHFQSP